MSSPSLFIVGSGPGIALKAAQKFASEGFNIALISRSASKLAEQAKLIEEASTGSGKSGYVKVVTETADASDYDGTRQALEKVKEKLGNPTVVLYNAASLGMARTHALELTPQELEKHLSITTVGALPVLQWGAENVKASGSHPPTILVTGGGLAHNPRPPMAGLAVAKAGLLNLVKNFHNILKPEGIHVATITVCGMVKDEDPKYNATAIAEKYWAVAEEKDFQTVELVY